MPPTKEPEKIYEPEKSPFLVFAVGGRLGSGCSFVRDWLRHSLVTFGYKVEVIDVTTVFLDEVGKYLEIDESQEKVGEEIELERLTPQARRVRQLQSNGNKLRGRLGNEIISALCVNEVIAPYIQKQNVFKERKRLAFIIDSLKHPQEVRFLRNVFREAFCMIGVVASDRIRMKRLRERKGFDDQTFKQLSDIDANQHGVDHGQKAIDAVTEADYFFANDYATKAEIQGEAERLIRLIFGVEIQSPRRDEVGMQSAYKAAKRSACLSRQVGAAIFDAHGQILATGHNDVPQFGGGLYGPESPQDERCFARGGKCYNDEEKNLIVQELACALREQNLIREGVNEKVLQQAIRQSRIKNLIEFTRAVHAEMDAIIGVGRSASLGLVGSTLFCTTFPCHNCAKHIIDAGVSRVVYLEPYEKSLARKLHADAISNPEEDNQDGKIAFDLYGGVAPRRFDEYFGNGTDRKKDGKFVDLDRVRAGLLPSGAQEIDVLSRRIQYVTEKLGILIERVDAQPQELINTQDAGLGEAEQNIATPVTIVKEKNNGT